MCKDCLWTLPRGTVLPLACPRRASVCRGRAFPTSNWLGNGALLGLVDLVIWGFLRHNDIMDVTFPQSGTGDADKARALA